MNKCRTGEVKDVDVIKYARLLCAISLVSTKIEEDMRKENVGTTRIYQFHVLLVHLLDTLICININKEFFGVPVKNLKK